MCSKTPIPGALCCLYYLGVLGLICVHLINRSRHVSLHQGQVRGFIEHTWIRYFVGSVHTCKRHKAEEGLLRIHYVIIFYLSLLPTLLLKFKQFCFSSPLKPCALHFYWGRNIHEMFTILRWRNSLSTAQWWKPIKKNLKYLHVNPTRTRIQTHVMIELKDTNTNLAVRRVTFIIVLQPRPPGAPAGPQVRSITCCSERECAPLGTTGHLNMKVLEPSY